MISQPLTHHPPTPTHRRDGGFDSDSVLAVQFVGVRAAVFFSEAGEVG